MNKVLWTVMTMLLIAMASLGLLARHQAGQIGALKLANKTATEALNRAAKQRKLDLATIAARDSANAATARKFEQARQGLQTALQARQDWSEADVPPEVQSALLRDSGGPNNDAR